MVDETGTDYAVLRAAQVETLQACGASPMGLHHYMAVISGFPPDSCSIVTPETFRNQCDAGLVPESEKPLNKLEFALSEILGPRQAISPLKLSFNGNNPAEQRSSAPSPALANLFNPLNPV